MQIKIITMKKIWMCVLSLVVLAACDDMTKKVETKEQYPTDLVNNLRTAEASTDNTAGEAVFTFDKEEHDFGTLVDGEKVSYSFRFTNTGDAPLIISTAKGSCGCTVPNWPKEPIAPGEGGTIDVTFNSSGRSGVQSKAVTLTANTNPNRKVIRITSEVVSE